MFERQRRFYLDVLDMGPEWASAELEFIRPYEWQAQVRHERRVHGTPDSHGWDLHVMLTRVEQNQPAPLWCGSKVWTRKRLARKGRRS